MAGGTVHRRADRHQEYTTSFPFSEKYFYCCFPKHLPSPNVLARKIVKSSTLDRSVKLLSVCSRSMRNSRQRAKTAKFSFRCDVIHTLNQHLTWITRFHDCSVNVISLHMTEHLSHMQILLITPPSLSLSLSFQDITMTTANSFNRRGS